MQGNGAVIPPANGNAWFQVNLPLPTTVIRIGIKGTYQATTQLIAILNSGASQTITTLTSTNDWMFNNYNTTQLKEPVKSIRVTSTAQFQLFGISACIDCYEEITVDFGSVKTLGLLTTKAFSTSTISIDILAGTSLTQMTKVGTLNPQSVSVIQTPLTQAVQARYISFKHYMPQIDWAKANTQLIRAYDQNGYFGPPRKPVPSSHSFAQMLGVNGIWGWGVNEGSENLKNNSMGPKLYAEVCTHARNYHSLDWDITSPNHIPDYQKMAQGHGTEAQPWLIGIMSMEPGRLLV
jgi:hypothetical protein